MTKEPCATPAVWGRRRGRLDTRQDVARLLFDVVTRGPVHGQPPALGTVEDVQLG